MYPTEEYVTAHIAAKTDELRQSRRNWQAARNTPGPLNRLYESVAGMLNRGAAGTSQTTNPQPAN